MANEIKLVATISDMQHTFLYNHKTLEDVLCGYEFLDKLAFVTCWDYGYHPIDLYMPDGTILKLMSSVVMADYCWGKGRITFDEYLKVAKESRAVRDAVPYLYHIERMGGKCRYHEVYETLERANMAFEFQEEQVLRKQEYVKKCHATAAPDGRCAWWHSKDYCTTIMLTLKKLPNPTYAYSQQKNDVSSFMYYMWNHWSEQECKEVWKDDDYSHFWKKWCALSEKYSRFGAAEEFYAELSDHNQDKLVRRALECYERRKQIKN